MSQDFWARVRRCKHKMSPTYGVIVHCGHEDLGCSGGFESHCVKCGVYITEDPCGATTGMSGWPLKRWQGPLKKHWSPKVQWGVTA